MVLEARRLVDTGEVMAGGSLSALNAMGYEEAAQHVYGMTYDQWKELHPSKASPEQLERFKASEPIQAKHDKGLLAVRAEKSKKPANAALVAENSNGRVSTSLASNVCCEDVENVAMPLVADVKISRGVPSFQPPKIPPVSCFRNQKFPITAVLTVSDRAFTGMYETGDLSGPAVIEAVKQVTGLHSLKFVTAVVPDDSAAIQAKLRTLSDQGADLILTTGGTGFSPRDVTPEATSELVDFELTNLMAFTMTACSQQQALQTLSRGTAGILNNTVIANLPGNPAAVGEILPVLLPLLLHAVSDLHHVTPEVLHIG